MTNDERIAFLAENPIASRWDRRCDGSKWWTVTMFFSTGYGPTFTGALDDAIGSYREKAARHEAACAGLSETRRSTR